MRPEQVTKTCPDCGSGFRCGSGTCWCADLPHVVPLGLEGGCRCPNCLAMAIGRRIEDFISSVPHAEALRVAAAQPAARPLEHIDYTMEDGSLVFTRWSHLKRQECCGNGCRNCPYP